MRLLPVPVSPKSRTDDGVGPTTSVFLITSFNPPRAPIISSSLVSLPGICEVSQRQSTNFIAFDISCLHCLCFRHWLVTSLGSDCPKATARRLGLLSMCQH